MVRRTLNVIALQIGLLLIRAGWLPVMAVACLTAAAMLHFVAVPHVETRTTASQRQLAELQAGHESSAPSQVLAARYADIRAQLASSEDRGDLLKSLFKIAAENGVTLAQADYRVQSDPECACQRLQITLPVRGTYPRVRAFIDAALAAMSALSLDEISLRRESVKSPNVEAQLRLSLFLRAGD